MRTRRSHSRRYSRLSRNLVGQVERWISSIAASQSLDASPASSPAIWAWVRIEATPLRNENEGKVDQAKASLKDAGEKIKDAFKS